MIIIKQYDLPDKIYLAITSFNNRYNFLRVVKDKPYDALYYNFLTLDECNDLFEYFLELETGETNLDVEEK